MSASTSAGSGGTSSPQVARILLSSLYQEIANTGAIVGEVVAVILIVAVIVMRYVDRNQIALESKLSLL